MSVAAKWRTQITELEPYQDWYLVQVGDFVNRCTNLKVMRFEDIATALNQAGYPPLTGRRWTIRTVKALHEWWNYDYDAGPIQCQWDED